MAPAARSATAISLMVASARSGRCCGRICASHLSEGVRRLVKKASKAEHSRKAIVDDEDRTFEHSPLSGSSSRDGKTVDVKIYRFAGTRDPSQLVMVNLLSGCPTAWLNPSRRI